MSTPTAQVLFATLCVGLVTLSIVTPLAQSASHRDEASPGLLLRTPAETGTAVNTTDLPPGTSETGINNVTRLTEAHQSTVEKSSYEAEMEWDQVSAGSGRGSSWFEAVPISMTITSGVTESHTRLVSEEVEHDYWVTENATAVKTSVDSHGRFSMYQYHNTPQPWEEAMSETVHDWLNTSTYDFTGTLNRNNRTLYEFWASGLRGNLTPIAGVHARVLIDREGVIHKAIVTRTYRTGNETVAARLNYTLQQPGAAPPTRPEWVTAELPQLDASVNGNGTVIALEHTGGMSVPKATMKTFFPDRTQTTTDIEGFEPGETLYLYRLQGTPHRLHVNENEAPTVNETFVPVGEDSVLVSVFDRPASLFGGNDSLLIEVEPRKN